MFFDWASAATGGGPMRDKPSQPSFLTQVREKIAQIENGTLPTSTEESKRSFRRVGGILSGSTKKTGGGTTVKFASEIDPDDFARAVVVSKGIWRKLGLDDAAIEESIADDSSITQAYVPDKTTMSIVDLRNAVYPALRRGSFERAPTLDEQYAWKIMMGLRRLVVDSSKISKARRNAQKQTMEAKQNREMKEMARKVELLGAAARSDLPDYLDNENADYFAELDSRAEYLAANRGSPLFGLESEVENSAGDELNLIVDDRVRSLADPGAAGPADDEFGLEALDRVRSPEDPDAAGPASADPGFLDAYLKEYYRFPGL